MKILVTGGSGQLGRALREVFEGRHQVIWTDLEDLDIRDLAGLRALLGEERPEAVLHLAAITQVDACERQPETAFEVNALGARYVALAAREIGAEILLVSTDYVFDGRSGHPYQEYDDPRPLNVYGRSKLHAERAVASLTEAHTIVRTSGLFGPGGVNFVQAILDAHEREGHLRVVADQLCRPTYTGHLAEALARMVGSGNHGIFHVASAGEVSWFDFARAILETVGKDPSCVESISSDQLQRPAQRPAYSVLDTRAYELTFGHVLPHWREGLDGILARQG
ncbi:MAG: dTDP-4-dehydrorhamnose reductase [Candidatus Eisenbacteria sp.]|nr:dTDP-4-dehydrorhamnose reductase [Candidatus Eisenbacteria bacterium]